MRPGAAAAADWVIAELPVTHDPIDLESLIVRIGTHEGWFASIDEAQELAERWKPRFLVRVTNNLNSARDLGRPARYDFNSSNPDWIQGSSFVEATDSQDVSDSKQARIHADSYLEFAQSLTGREFEGVCRGILDLMGCESPVLTPRGNDQGIDFHGVIEMAGRLNRKYAQIAVDRAMRSWIVGQAKQVGDPVGTGEIRELVGSIELARAGISADNGKALAELGVKKYGSMFGIFITTGEFTRDAWRLMERSGIVAMDGPMVAAFLADHAVADVGGACEEAAFLSWVADQLAGGP